jgi:hypothetical protein
MISLEKPYRTQDGCQVRALRYHHRHRIMGGETLERVILGEAKIENEWTEVLWNEHGFEIFGNINLDLVEWLENATEQPQLFQ